MKSHFIIMTVLLEIGVYGHYIYFVFVNGIIIFSSGVGIIQYEYIMFISKIHVYWWKGTNSWTENL